MTSIKHHKPTPSLPARNERGESWREGFVELFECAPSYRILVHSGQQREFIADRLAGVTPGRSISGAVNLGECFIRVGGFRVQSIVLLILILCAFTLPAVAQSPVKVAAPAGKLVPRPLYRDPVFDAPTDPVFCYNAEQNKWFMYYTARRAAATNAPGVTWIHGSSIGMAESADGGATWTYRGTADIGYGKDVHPNDFTYWAPEVIWVASTYHMFLTYVPGIFNDWNHPREIVHLTSKDGIKWDTVGHVDLNSDRTIDACVIQIPGGTWRMWFKDERKTMMLSYADSPDLIKWEAKGNAVTNFNGEGPKVIHWKGRYWLIADCWANGMRVWSSDDCLNWKLQQEPLFGSHGDVVISSDRAWWFYFGGPRTPPAARATPLQPALLDTSNAPVVAAPRPARGRSTVINVVELSVVDGKLIPGDPEQPTYIDLKPERELEK